MPKIQNEVMNDGAVMMTLELECWPDELSPAQLAAYETAELEHFTIRSKLNEILNTTSGSESLFFGEIFSAYQVPGTAPGIETIAKPMATVRNENKARQAAEEKCIKSERGGAERKREWKIAPGIQTIAKLVATGRNENKARQAAEEKCIKSERGGAERKREWKIAPEPVYAEDAADEENIPISKRSLAVRARTRPYEKKEVEPLKIMPERKQIHQSPPTNTFRPSENTSIGGLSLGEKKKEVLDLTTDDNVTKLPPHAREVNFNALQGKTFPSLLVVARPSLNVTENTNDRPVLDAKVKGVLMQTTIKCTEWLIQQGLVRSEQTCRIHSGRRLKLGMYSDASKFAYSGGYVWISTCCPTRFVSVFNGSLFEGASHPPSLLLKLIYHWSCQTNAQNVVKWVNIDNLYVKGVYSLLRSVCTVALHQNFTLLGGHGKKIEVGVVSLGTTSPVGQQQKRQVKVEILGVLDNDTKIVRLRAVEPLNDGQNNYKKRFLMILEPLARWVHCDSQILTDLTVDTGTLQTMGFHNVLQAKVGDNKSSNGNIMEYLRRIVPRMFQNTLQLLSLEIIQSFLDELVWRECYGTTPGTAFDNIVTHIGEQTRLDATDTLVTRLNKVAANPFMNWAHLAVMTPAQKLRDDFFNAPSTSAVASTSEPSPQQQQQPLSKRARKRRELR